MKGLLLCSAVLLGATLAAHAQVLPVPGGKNPDWVLFGAYRRPYDSQAIWPPSTSPMPNAAGKSILSTVTATITGMLTASFLMNGIAEMPH